MATPPLPDEKLQEAIDALAVHGSQNKAAEACAIGDDTDAILVLFARMVERKALGTLQPDELGALVRLLTSTS